MTTGSAPQGQAASGAEVSAGPAALGYAEDHCALRWPLLAAGLYAPALALALFVASLAAGGPALSWVAVTGVILATLWWAVGGGMWLRYLWPVGIRLDQSGLRIGGVRWAERHPGRERRRAALVPWQCSQVFSCPWSGLVSVGVTTDRAAIKIMKKYAYRGRRITPLANLAVPYMRAALVIWVDEDQAHVPDIRPASGPLWSNCGYAGYHQPLWIAPTRHPARLAQALAVQPLPSGRLSDPADLFDADPPVPHWSSR